MRIENNDGLSALIRSGEETRLATGFGFTEGPIWIPDDDCLLFSDIPNDRIHRWRPGTGEAEVYREPSRNANGLTLDAAGAVLACEHSGRRVSRAPYADPANPPTLVDRFGGHRFNSPNDVVVHSGGPIYFTDPTSGIRDSRQKGDTSVEQELPFQGVYRLDPDGGLTCLDRSFTQPNGLAFSPDESVLYVGDSQDRFVKRFAVEADGLLGEGELFVDMRGDERTGNPDGMKVDEDGRLWVTGAGGVWVVQPDGRLLGVLAIPENPANIAFGGPEFGTIYLTARTSVYAVETTVRGIAPGSRTSPPGRGDRGPDVPLQT